MAAREAARTAIDVLSAALVSPVEAWRSRYRLRRETELLVASMPLPEPFDFDQLVQNIEQARGRQIVMRALPDRIATATSICGLYVKHDTRPLDLIFHTSGGSPWHEQQIKLHELVHLWAKDCAGLLASDDLLADFSVERIEQLVASGQVAARWRYETGIEQRAEDAATRINQTSDARYTIEDPTTRCLAQDFTYGSPAHP